MICSPRIRILHEQKHGFFSVRPIYNARPREKGRNNVRVVVLRSDITTACYARRRGKLAISKSAKSRDLPCKAIQGLARLQGSSESRTVLAKVSCKVYLLCKIIRDEAEFAIYSAIRYTLVGINQYNHLFAENLLSR